MFFCHLADYWKGFPFDGKEAAQYCGTSPQEIVMAIGKLELSPTCSPVCNLTTSGGGGGGGDTQALKMLRIPFPSMCPNQIWHKADEETKLESKQTKKRLPKKFSIAVQFPKAGVALTSESSVFSESRQIYVAWNFRLRRCFPQNVTQSEDSNLISFQ